jgi:MoaA/NifB/PqqE/SkfB family radical SAM enzyme
MKNSIVDYKSEFPYLVDISVGDSCPFNCEFCYTSSSTKGRYADAYWLTNVLADVLLKANVFNVVFGGGEPTLYQGESSYHNFASILKAYKSRNFVVGVTTRNYNFHRNKNVAEELNNIDSLAVSCSTLEDASKIRVMIEELRKVEDTKFPRIYLQLILGLTPWEDTRKLLDSVKEFGNGVTLLGYKSYGFGQQVKPFDVPDEWIQYVKSLHRNIGIDSILVAKYRDKLTEAGVPPYYMVGSEGKSSCYIDALKQIVKPSSFTDVHYPIPTGWNRFNTEWFLETFAKF